MPKRDRSVSDQAHEAIKDRIVTLGARPGQRLDEVALAGDLGLSRTPVREALFRSELRGPVVVGERGGFTVRPLDLMDVSALFEAHAVVARAIARLVVARATEADLRRLAVLSGAVREATADGSPADVAATNARLHRHEAAVARSEHLRALADTVHDQGQRLAYLCFGGEGRSSGLDEHFTRVCTDHEDALDAFRHGDAAAAERVAARHVQLFRDRVVEFFATDTLGDLDLGADLPAAPFLS